MDVPIKRVRVHFGYVNSGRDEGFRYSRGNPAVRSKLEPVQFDDLNPITISGFIKYLWIAGLRAHFAVLGIGGLRGLRARRRCCGCMVRLASGESIMVSGA